MFSRDLEVHALAIESTRLMVQAEAVLRSLQTHQTILTEFVEEVRGNAPVALPDDFDMDDLGRHRLSA